MVKTNNVMQKNPSHSQRGFTLIELSIVLVIIGLIVGGVLVGQDLIKASEIRATVGQIEKYNSAVNTFRSKFNGLPGDLSAANANSFGFTTRTGGSGRGDNNGLIEGTGGTNTNQVFTEESGMLWNDLSIANVIDGNYTANAANQDAAGVPVVSTANVPNVFPPARLGRGNYITVGSTSGLNYWLVTGITGVTATTGAYGLTTNLTPIEGYNMDNKLDDGIPLTGVVQARGDASSTTTPFTDPSHWSTSTPGSAVTGDCVTTGANGTDPTDTYNRGLLTGGSSPGCIIRFRFN